MKEVSVLQALYAAFIRLLSSHQDASLDPQETPRVESTSQREYFVSHIDDYCDCV